MSLQSGVGYVPQDRISVGGGRRSGRGGNPPGPWTSALLAASPDVQEALADLRRAWKHFDEVSGVLPDDPPSRLQVVRRVDVATADLTCAERRVVFLLQAPQGPQLDQGAAGAPAAGGGGATAGRQESGGRARTRQTVVGFSPRAPRRASHGAGGGTQSA